MKETILNKGKTIWNKNMIIACLIGVCMIWELERLVNIPFLSDIDQWIQTMEMILLGAVIAVIDWRENRWVWIFFGGIVLVFLTSAVRSADILEQTKAPLMRGVFVYLLCPMIGIILSGKALDKFVKVMTIIWVLFFSILSIVGIYAAANGLPMTDYTGNRPLGVGPEGLLVLLDYHQNVTASHMLIALMMALIMMFFYRHAAWKAFSVITMVPMFFGQSAKNRVRTIP